MKTIFTPIILGILISINLMAQDFHKYTHKEMLNICPHLITNITKKYNFRDNNKEYKADVERVG